MFPENTTYLLVGQSPEHAAVRLAVLGRVERVADVELDLERAGGDCGDLVGQGEGKEDLLALDVALLAESLEARRERRSVGPRSDQRERLADAGDVGDRGLGLEPGLRTR